MFNKDELLLKSLDNLSLTPTMEKNAREKYEALSEYLGKQGLDSDFYPQGSFLMGTVIKPFKDGKNKDYDLDILAIIDGEKDNTFAKSIKNDVGDCLKTSGLYSDKLDKEDRHCWTLKYAEVSKGIGFSLDIVPAVDESNDIKNEIISSGVSSNLVDKTVAITDKKNNDYEWLTSNPLGFGEWFINISDNHISQVMILEQYKRFSEDFRAIYASVEEIPKYYYRSNLQKAVQLVKRYRDIYYDRVGKYNDRPSSMLLSALIADSVKDEYNLSITEIINKFINGYVSGTISIMMDNKIVNPVDLRENLLNSYTTNQKNELDKWIYKLNEFISVDEEIMFKRGVNKNINESIYLDAFETPKEVIPTKPWRRR